MALKLKYKFLALFLIMAGPVFGGNTSLNLPSYKCHPQKNFNLCIPNISKGFKILGLIEDESKLKAMEEELKSSLKNFSQEEAQSILLTNYEGVNFKVYDISSFFPSFIANNFNRPAPSRGPNCYNSALILSGLLNVNEISYYSIEEFEFYAKYFFEEIKASDLQAGDIILYDAKSSKLHVSTYLFNGLIFHKMGYFRYYYYRLIHEEDIFKADPFQSEPNYSRGESAASINESYAKKPKGYYRLKQGPDLNFQDQQALSKKEQDAINIVNYIHQSSFSNLKASQVASVMGYVSESLSSTLLNEFSFLNNNNRPQLKMSFLRLNSLHNQIHQALEESHFSSPMAHASQIFNEICWHDNQYTRDLSKLLFEYLEKSYNDDSIDQFILSLKSFDRSQCNLNLLKLVSEF